MVQQANSFTQSPETNQQLLHNARDMSQAAVQSSLGDTVSSEHSNGLQYISFSLAIMRAMRAAPQLISPGSSPEVDFGTTNRDTSEESDEDISNSSDEYDSKESDDEGSFHGLMEEDILFADAVDELPFEIDFRGDGYDTTSDEYEGDDEQEADASNEERTIRIFVQASFQAEQSRKHNEDGDSSGDSSGEEDDSYGSGDEAATAEDSEYDFDEEYAEETNEDESSQEKVDTPFWFGFQDAEHVSKIMEVYAVKSGVEEQRKQSVRAPPPFIGKVSSIPLGATGPNNGFATLDLVDVFQDSEAVPWGTVLTPTNIYHFLTCWDDDGLPNQMKRISGGQYKGLRQQVGSKRRKSQCYLYSTPLGNLQYEYKASRTTEPLTRGHTSHPCYDRFIPKKSPPLAAKLQVTTLTASQICP